MKRLIDFGQANPEALEDLMLCMAYAAEDALIASGAEPGKDYTRLDCFKLGQPFALKVFSEASKTKQITFPSEGDKG